METRVRDLEHRIGRLERANRMLAAALSLTVIAVLAAAARAPQTVELVQAKRIQLVDGEGRVRVDLRHDDEETGLFIMDEVGGTRLGAAQFAHGGGGFALHGPDMKGAAVLYLAGGEGSVSMYDRDGNRTARFPSP